MTLRSGIHLDVRSDEYFGDPCPAPSLTQSIAKLIVDQSPLHAWHAHPRLGGGGADEDDAIEKYDSAQAIGNAAHKLMIGRGKEIAVGHFDAWRSKEAKEFREVAELAGHVAILEKHFTRARAMVAAAKERVEVGTFNGEVVIIWQEGDLWFRSMIDMLSEPKLVWDYKTTGMSVAPHAIPGLMVSSGWDIQAAMHERGLDRLDPEAAGQRRFRFIAQENYEPYALTVCELPDEVLIMGRKKLDHAIGVWSECIKSRVWPGYPADICRPKYPSWAEAQWLDREIDYAARGRHSHAMLTDLSGG